MDVYILCGLPGSGKSTWARNMAEVKGAMIVNRDAIRTMYYGSYKFNKDLEYIIKNSAERLVQELLDCDVTDIVIDECNISPLARAFWLNCLKIHFMDDVEKESKIFAVWFKETERNVLFRSQDDLRGYTKEYWHEVVDKMKSSFVPPKLIEGFGDIIEVNIE